MRRPIPLLLCVIALASVQGGCASTPPEDGAEANAGGQATESRKAKTIDRASASGDFAIAQASGSIDNPGTIKVKVTSKPPQKVSVSWALVCSQGAGAGSKDGQFSARTPVTRALKKPAKKVRDCIASANAQLSTGGRVTVVLTG